MKRLIFLIIAAGLVWGMMWQLRRVTRERDRYRRNTEVLAQEVEQYKTADSLHVARAGVLELRLSEFRRLRSRDAAMIASLKSRARDLENLTTSQMQTIVELRGRVRDSIIYRDRVAVDTLRCLDISDTWFDLHGCANKAGEFVGEFVNRDSLAVVETVKYRRFLGFLWRTKRIKERAVEVVSKNPHTQILHVESIVIRK